jgi:hypothetical protein
MTLGRWSHLGHRLGECWVDEVNDKTYIHIPKNASSFVKGVLIGSGGFWHHSETLINSSENIIVLRDPIDRWVSGITQYLHNSNQIDMPAELIFDKVTFDDHTDLQTYFLQGADLTKSTFMFVDDNLRANLANWIYDHGYRTNVDIAIEYNASSEDDRATTKDYYTKLLDQNPEFVLKLQQHFEEDYKLIGKVKFYGN